MQETQAHIPKRFLNIDEAAAYIGVPKSTVYRLVEGRNIPHNRIGDRTLRFDIRALDKWMERRLVPAKTQISS